MSCKYCRFAKDVLYETKFCPRSRLIEHQGGHRLKIAVHRDERVVAQLEDALVVAWTLIQGAVVRISAQAKQPSHLSWVGQLVQDLTVKEISQ